MGTGGTISGVAQLSALNVVSSGTFTSTNVQSVIQTVSAPASTQNHNMATGNIFYVTGATANWTANFTGISTTSNRMSIANIIIVQGSTPYSPTAVQINGTAASVLWFGGGSAPGGVSNYTDVFTFNILNINGTFSVLGQHSTY